MMNVPARKTLPVQVPCRKPSESFADRVSAKSHPVGHSNDQHFSDDCPGTASRKSYWPSADLEGNVRPHEIVNPHAPREAGRRSRSSAGGEGEVGGRQLLAIKDSARSCGSPGITTLFVNRTFLSATVFRFRRLDRHPTVVAQYPAKRTRIAQDQS